jgi:hypothetical protein
LLNYFLILVTNKWRMGYSSALSSDAGTNATCMYPERSFRADFV